MSLRHRKKRLKAWRIALAIPRSIYFNLRMLPWSQACRLPILVSHRTRLEELSGHVELAVRQPKTGLVKIGFATCQCSDFNSEHTRLALAGTLRIAGSCAIGAGCSVEVAEGAVLSLGNDFHLGPRSVVVCHRDINIAADVLTSWNCTLMDTDQHALVDATGSRVNEDRPVVIGEGCWLGCHVIVPKGVTLPPHTTVAAGARLAGRYTDSCTVLAGNPARVVKEGVRLSNRTR